MGVHAPQKLASPTTYIHAIADHIGLTQETSSTETGSLSLATKLLGPNMQPSAHTLHSSVRTRCGWLLTDRTMGPLHSSAGDPREMMTMPAWRRHPHCPWLL